MFTELGWVELAYELQMRGSETVEASGRFEHSWIELEVSEFLAV
jgi:hypothetical protein